MTNVTFATWTDQPTPVRLTPEPWVEEALCAETDPDAWFPEGRGSFNARVFATCMACPVREQCLEYALKNNEQHGIWGAKTLQQRRNILKKRAQAAGARDE